MASRATKTKKSTASKTQPALREPAAPRAPKGCWENPLIPNARLQQIYANMLRAQMLEAKLVPASERMPEAVASALLIDLRAEDALASTASSHRFLKGVPLKQLFAKKKLRASLSQQTDHGFPAHNVLPVIADSAVALNAAMGVALACQRSSCGDRNSDIVLAFTADAAACVRAARFAEEHRLPILFVFPQKGTKAALSLATRRYGIPGMPVDRDDALAVYRVAQEAIARARSGGGPTLIECMRYIATPRRGQSALATLERSLKRKGLFTASWKRALVADFRRQLAQAVKAARKKAKR
ncbi:MAG TPA: thiamine pyrophosphate-dependent enzyme [Acidobacteriaceae bacterium]|nr:thiamine pyrophosphate-dependent enzyme [Acidobacteriaceae bacterium]